MAITIVYVLVFSLLLVYVFVLLKYIRHWNNTPDFSFSANKSATLISVIIPFHNEEKSIDRLVQSLTQQTLKKESWEVLFVNDNSTDESIKVINRFCGNRFNFRIISNEGFGKKAALIKGINSVNQGLIVTTDADCYFSSGWLSAIASFYEKNSPDMIIMPVVMTGEYSFWQQLQVTDFIALQMVGAGSALSGNPILCNGANLAFKKIDENVKLKEEYASGEDMFLLEWMKQKGRDIEYLKSQEVIATTPGPETFKQFLNQRARWISKAGGYGDITIIFSSLLFFIVNLSQLMFFIFGLINPEFMLLWAIWFVAKTVVDYSLISIGSRFFNIKTSIARFIIMQFIYPIYMLVVTGQGFLFPVKWKHK